MAIYIRGGVGQIDIELVLGPSFKRNSHIQLVTNFNILKLFPIWWRARGVKESSYS